MAKAEQQKKALKDKFSLALADEASGRITEEESRAIEKEFRDAEKRVDAIKNSIKQNSAFASGMASQAYEAIQAQIDGIDVSTSKSIDKLKAENARIKAVAITPVDKQAKRCDSLLQIELYKNQKLSMDLATEKAKSNNCEKALADAKKQIDLLNAEKKRLEDQLKSVAITEDCTPYKNKIAQLEQLLAAERNKSAGLTSELEALKKSVADIKQQLTAEQAKTKDLEAKLKLCIPKDQLD